MTKSLVPKIASVGSMMLAGCLLFSSCKQDQPVQTRANTIPSNTIPYDAVSLSSMGAATLTPSGSSIIISPMNSGSDGVATAFTSKKAWTQYGTIGFAGFGDTMQIRTIDDSVVSTMSMVALPDTAVSLAPVFTSQPTFEYSEVLYNGSTEVDSVGGLNAGSPLTKIKIAYSSSGLDRNFQKGGTPQGQGYWIYKGVWTFFSASPGPRPTCWWHYNDTVAHTVVDPNHVAYEATSIDFIETISGGSYSYPTFNGIQEVGDCGSIRIDSVAVN